MNHQADWLIYNISKHGWKYGAELGLGQCITSSRLLRSTQITLIGVDHAKKPHRKQAQLNLKEKYGSRFILYQDTTLNASKYVAEESLDYVFIDAGHSYKACLQDIRKWYPKVKPGGCLCGHDYVEKYRGVIQAVTESFPEHSVAEDYGIWYIFKGEDDGFTG